MNLPMNGRLERVVRALALNLGSFRSNRGGIAVLGAEERANRKMIAYRLRNQMSSCSLLRAATLLPGFWRVAPSRSGAQQNQQQQHQYQASRCQGRWSSPRGRVYRSARWPRSAESFRLCERDRVGEAACLFVSQEEAEVGGAPVDHSCKTHVRTQRLTRSNSEKSAGGGVAFEARPGKDNSPSSAKVHVYLPSKCCSGSCWPCC